MNEETSLNIYQRLNKIREAVAYLKKDATVTGYKAITHDFVISELRQYLVKFGVITVPRQVSYEIRDTGKTTAKGIPFTNYIGMYEFDFVNIDEPDDKVTASIGAMSEDTADKGPGGAVSYAMKYAFLKIFNIETGENDESRQEQKPEYISLDQVTEINDLIKETKADKVKLLKVVKAESIEKILQSSYPMLIKLLKKKQENMRVPGQEG